MMPAARTRQAGANAPAREIAGILLAAGQGSRFGGGKMSHPLEDGMPLAVRSALNLQQGCGNVLVMVRPGDDALILALQQHDLPWQTCPQAQAGMGHTLATAVGALPDAAGWLIALGDMPWVAPDTIARVCAALNQGALLARPSKGGRPGHPVGFDAALRDELLALQGDTGARALLTAHAASLCDVDCDDPGIHQDVDTPADLIR